MVGSNLWGLLLFGSLSLVVVKVDFSILTSDCNYEWDYICVGLHVCYCVFLTCIKSIMIR